MLLFSLSLSFKRDANAVYIFLFLSLPVYCRIVALTLTLSVLLSIYVCLSLSLFFFPLHTHTSLTLLEGLMLYSFGSGSISHSMQLLTTLTEVVMNLSQRSEYGLKRVLLMVSVHHLALVLGK